MQDNKKYIIEIEGKDGQMVKDASWWERNKDSVFERAPKALVYEVADYDENDSRETDQYLLGMEGYGDMDLWDSARWERNKDQLATQFPNAVVKRVRYVDYWGDQKSAIETRQAEIEDRLKALRDEDSHYLHAPVQDAPVSSELTAPVSEPVYRSTPATRPQKKDLALLDQQKRLMETNPEYSSLWQEKNAIAEKYEQNPYVIAQREAEADYEANYLDYLEKDVRENMGKAGLKNPEREQFAFRPSAPGLGAAAQQASMYHTGDFEKDPHKAQYYADALNYIEAAKGLKEEKEGFGQATYDVAKSMYLQPLAKEAATAVEIWKMLDRLEEKYGDLNDIDGEKIEETLTDEEKSLLLSYFAYNSALQDAEHSKSVAYKAGEIFGRSIPFMLEFVLTGGVSKLGAELTKKASKGFISWILRKTGKVARSQGTKWMLNTLGKGATRLLTNIVPTMVGETFRTVAQPTTYFEMLKSLPQYGEDGHLHVGKNMAVSFADRVIENFSEASGELLLGAFGKAKGNTPYGKTRQFLSNLGFQGLPAEIFEEIEGAALRELTGVDTKAFEHMFDTDNFAAMVIGFAPMTMIGATTAGVGMTAATLEMNSAAKRIQKELAGNYSQAQIDHALKAIRQTNTPNEAVKTMKALLSGAEWGNATGAQVKALWDYGKAVATYKSMFSEKQEMDRAMRDAKAAEMEQQYGKYWQEQTDAEGNAVAGSQKVSVAILNDGRKVFMLETPNEQGEFAIKDRKTGEVGFAKESDIKTYEVDGENVKLQEDFDSIDNFVDAQIMSERKSDESVRMEKEKAANIEALKAEIKANNDAVVLGTEGDHRVVYVKEYTDDGVVAYDEAGNRVDLTWQDVSNVFNMGQVEGKSDEQLMREEIDRIVNERGGRKPVEKTEIPRREDGSIDEDAFWNQSPEAWAEWNDKQNNDNGADTYDQILSEKASLEAQLKEVQKQKTSAPFKRREANRAAKQIADRLARLTAMEEQYAERFKTPEQKRADMIAKAKEIAKMWQEKWGITINIIEDKADITYKEVKERLDVSEDGTFAWTDLGNKVAEIYMPNITSVEQFKEKVAHEVVSHIGLRALLGEKYNSFLERVWGAMSESSQKVFYNYAAASKYKGLDRIHYAADEYVAHIAERMGVEALTAEEQTFWQKLLQFLKDLFSGDLFKGITENEIINNLKKSYQNLESGQAANADTGKGLRNSMRASSEYEALAAELTPEEIAAVASNDLQVATQGYETLLASAPKVEQGETSKAFVERKRAYAEQLKAAKDEMEAKMALMDEVNRTAEQAEQEVEPVAEVKESVIEEQEPVTFMEVADEQEPAIRFSVSTEDYLREQITNYANSKEGKKAGWTPEQIQSVLDETGALIEAIHNSSTGNEFYDEFAKKDPTIRVDWRDGVARPIVTWTRANIEYKYDMSADLLCINNEALEDVLSSPAMIELMEQFNVARTDKEDRKGADGKTRKVPVDIRFTPDDYLELYNTLKDMGFVVPCKGCFDAAGRFKMLPSVAQKFADEVNAVIDERNTNPEAFDEALRAKKGAKTESGLPATSSSKNDAIRVGVAGDNLTEHIKWTQLMSADGQTKMLSDWGGIFRAWQRTGAGRPKDKLLPEPYYGDIVSQQTTIIAAYGDKTPSFRDILVNKGTGLRRNSHSEFRPVLAVDEIQFMRDAFIKNLTVFKYMKEIDDVRLFGKLGVKFNMSFFPAFVEGAPAAGLDKDGNYIASEESVGAREFPYTDENGVKHYDGMKGWKEAQKYVNEDVSLSSVIFSYPHLIKALTDVPTVENKEGLWGSLIPFHSSGATTSALRAQGLGEARANDGGAEELLYDYDKGVSNFEDIQNDRFGEGWVVVEGSNAGKEVKAGHKMEFAGGTHYYNKGLGIHLYKSKYILDSELPEGIVEEDGHILMTKEQLKQYEHDYEIDYNNKVRELGTATAYKDAADFYLDMLPKMGLIPRFDYFVPEATFLQMCADAHVDPHHPKIGWKGEGNGWSIIDSPAYYSLFCDYGMTNPATGEWAPHRPVGVIKENGERVFEMPENTVEIVREGLNRYTATRRGEQAKMNEAIRNFAQRSVANGRISEDAANAVLEKMDKEQAELGGLRFSIASTKEEFDEMQKDAVAQKGIVTNGLETAVVSVVNVPRHDFTGRGIDAIHKAKDWALRNIAKEHTYHEGKADQFTYEIDEDTIGKYLSKSSTQGSDNLGVHLAALKKLPEIIDASVEVEVHPDYKKVGKRSAENGVDKSDLLIHRLYGAIEIDGKVYRAKTTIHENRDKANEAYDYKITEIELIVSGSSASDARTNPTSITATKLLQGVEKSYDSGKKITDIIYERAVNSGDMETAQRMVTEAARLAMPNTKVVDENGNPKVVYHGTNLSAANKGVPFWVFYEDQHFGTKAQAEVMANAGWPDSIRKVYDVYIDIINLKRVKDVPQDWIKTHSEYWEPIFAEAKAQGYDGLVYVNEWEDSDSKSDSYVVFSPSQIKSADPVTYDDNGNVIPLSQRFNPENADIRFSTRMDESQQGDLRFSVFNENQTIFVSNAAKAVEGIQMGKATPEQWLNMLTKNGGLKAAEDKWLGLSDWLKASDKKSLTKDEVLQFINENKIQIVEQHYAGETEDSFHDNMVSAYGLAFRDRFIDEAFVYDDYVGEGWDINNEEEAAALYTETTGDSVEYDEFGSLDENSVDKVRRWANEVAEEVSGMGGTRAINPTRLRYTTGGLKNKREIALTVPSVESWNKKDDLHFGDAGEGRAIAWVRFGDGTGTMHSEESAAVQKEIKSYIERLQEKYGADVASWTETEREELSRLIENSQNSQKQVNALVIDEIQSKRHQDAKESGYRTKEHDKQKKELLDVVVEKQNALLDYIGTLVEKYPNTDYDIDDVFKNFGRFSTEEKDELLRLKDEYNRAAEESINYGKEFYERVPEAPFEKNWAELAMKRMLRYAAENGYDAVAWTQGEQQVRRYKSLYDYKNISVGKWKTYEGTKKREVRLLFNDGGTLTLGVDEKGKITRGQYAGEKLSAVIGKEIASKIMSSEGEVNLTGEDLTFGEGMKGFYDKMLPAFMNKYGKKWGVKVSDMEFPNLEDGLTMHSVPVTEEMKESVMQGQIMFSVVPHESSMDEVDSMFKQYNGDPFVRDLYGKVSELAHTMGLKISFAEGMGRNAGLNALDKIKYNVDYFNSPDVYAQDKAKTLLHELIHSVTRYAIYAKDAEFMSPRLKEAVAQLESIYEEIKSDPSFEGMYGVTNVEEMVSELANVRFRAKLREKNLLQKIVDAIKDLLGIDKGDKALDNLSATLEDMIFNFDRAAYEQVRSDVSKQDNYIRFSTAPSSIDIEAVKGLQLFESMGYDLEGQMKLAEDSVVAALARIKYWTNSKKAGAEQGRAGAQHAFEVAKRQMELLRDVQSQLIDVTYMEPAPREGDEPQNIREYIAQMLTGKNGSRLTPETLEHELGWSAADRAGMKYIVSSKGMSVNELAELIMADAPEHVLRGMESDDVRNEILDFLQSVRTYAEIRDYMANARMAEAKAEADQHNADIDRFKEEFEAREGMTVEQYNEMVIQQMKEARDAWLASAENPAAFTPEEEKDVTDVPSDEELEGMTVDEIVSSGKQKMLEAAAEAKDSFMERVFKINARLDKVRAALAAQREYDQTTAALIADMANEMLENGALSKVTRAEIKRIVSAVKNAVGKQDITPNVDRIMDVMIGNQIRNAKNRLNEFLKIKGKKVNSSGVEVQGKLDIEGQGVLAAMKKGMAYDMAKLESEIAEAEDRLFDSSQVISRDAANELAGLYMAQEYMENIKASEAEEVSLRDELDKAQKERRAGRMSREAYREYEKSIVDAVRENRMQRVTAYENLLDNMAERVMSSIAKANALREADKARVERIHHFANSDMEGMPADELKQTPKGEAFWNNSIVQFFLSPLATFDQMLRHFAPKSRDGKGYLWNHFMGGWMKAAENEYTGVRDAHSVLDEKAREVFGKDVKRWSDIFSIADDLPKMKFEVFDAGRMKEYEFTQGNLMYIYMVNKMSDGKMKLRRMGITEEQVEQIAREMDPRLIELADWLQDSFLPSLREKYNAVHERMFGAPMAAIENYFPLVVNQNARAREEDVNNPQGTAKPSTITGAIIKRTKNSAALDLLNADALDVILGHVEQMEHWAAFAEWNRDLNTLLSYKKFRNRLQNASGIYGAGKELWKNFRTAAEIAAGVYQPAGKGVHDKLALNLAKGVTGAKIAFRVYTALKQFLSMPAFVSDSRPDILMKNMANPMGAWNWAMDNLPLFEKRWKSRQAGDSRLMATESDWKMWQTKAVEIAGRVGMTPNAFVDAVTVSIGARSIYETKYRQYLDYGYTEEQAREKAKLDAQVLFNESQQSNEAAFLSQMQVDRTWWTSLLTVFRNSSMGYQRMYVDALRNLGRMMKKGYKDESIEYMKKQMVRDGLTEEQAQRAAERIYRRSFTKNATQAFTFGFLVQFAWNLGPVAVYLLMGDDDDEKWAMLKDAAVRGLVGGPVEGLAAGQLASSLIGNAVMGEKISETDGIQLPAISDLESLKTLWDTERYRALNDLFNLAAQSLVGVNPQTFTDVVTAVVDACDGDMETSKEVMFAVMRILQVPQSQISSLYMDEIDLTADEAYDMTVQEFAERYAKYKMMRNAPLTKGLYPEEDAKAREEKYIMQFLQDMKEKRKTRGSEEAQLWLEYIDTEFKEMGETLRDLNRRKEETAAASDERDEVNAELRALKETEAYDKYEAAKKVADKYEAYKEKPTDIKKELLIDRWNELMDMFNAPELKR